LVYFYKKYLIKKKIYKYNVFEIFGLLSWYASAYYALVGSVPSPDVMDLALDRPSYDWIGQYVKS